MIDATVDFTIYGFEIHCEITAVNGFVAPIFCFSLMAPPVVVFGGKLIRTDGGYGEVKLPDLASGVPHKLVLKYADSDYSPVNRAWLPLGAYLRVGKEIISFPKQRSGILETTPPPIPEPKGLCLVPEPKCWRPSAGTFAISLLNVRCSLWDRVEALAARCNLDPLQARDGVPTSVNPDEALAENGYRIEIASAGIVVTYGGDKGAHYAGISLLVLRESHNGKLPCGILEDEPRFNWRGQHLDCARHFYKVDSITKLLDLMALLKMNRFHWHFSDDEAFRLQLDCLPELAEQTGERGEGRLIPGVFGGGSGSGGTYTKECVKAVIQHAKNLFVEVMPEIEFPAHSLALARALPQTRDPDDHGNEVSVQGYIKNVLNPALPATWETIEEIANEVSGLFPFGTLHLGADELPQSTWAGSPAVNKLKREANLKTSDDVLGWSLNRLAAKLVSMGVKSAAWEEAARGNNGGIGNDAMLFSWSGQQAGIEAAMAGYDVVMLPAQHVYLDMAHTDEASDWGAAWASIISLTDTINWSVIPDNQISDRVIGVEGTFWSEFTTNDSEMEPMMAPRILGVASKGWCDNDDLDHSQFITHARLFCEILTKMGWAWNSACFAK